MSVRERNRAAKAQAKARMDDVADHAARSPDLLADLWAMVPSSATFPLPDGGRGKGKTAMREGYMGARNVHWTEFERDDDRLAFAAGWLACLLAQRKREMRAENAASASGWNVARTRIAPPSDDGRRSHRASENPRLNAVAILRYLARIPCGKDGLSFLSRCMESMPAPIKLNRRPSGIIPQPFATPTDPKSFVLPVALPDMPGPTVGTETTATLPGLELAETQPALVAALLAGSFGNTAKRRLALRLFIEFLLSVPVERRDDTVMEIGPVSIREIVTDWLLWDPRRYAINDRKTGMMLRAAIPEINTMAIPWGDNGGFYYPLLVRGVTGYRLRDTISLLAQLPSGGKVGPMVDRTVLRFLGSGAKQVVDGKRRKRTGAWAAWRLYLAMTFDWNKHGSFRVSKGNGAGKKHALIRATRPEVQRDENGGVTDADGKVLRKSNGSAVTSPYHPAALLTGRREPNPARSRYKPKTVDELVAMAFVDQPETHRGVYRSRAIEAALLLESMGICHIERMGPAKGHGFPWRIIPGDAPFDPTMSTDAMEDS